MELEEKVNEMEVQIAKYSERISKLEEWQVKQNSFYNITSEQC